MILTILLSFFSKIFLPRPPTSCESNPKSLQHPIYQATYLVLCNRAKAAARWSAFGISCENPERLWIRFSLDGFSPHIHKGNAVSVSSPSALSCASCSVTSLLRFHTPPRKPPPALTMPSLYPSAPNTHVCTSLCTCIHKQANIYMCQSSHTRTHCILLCTVAPSQDP